MARKAASIQDAVHVIAGPLDVRPGDVIRWTNFNLASHTATADYGGFDTGTLRKGQSRSFVVSKDFLPSNHCAFHPHMKARVDLG
ncbi:MAG: hypothetical protein ACPGQM_00095 [Alphaproteobacteria bacterium]